MALDDHYGDEEVKEKGKWFPFKGDEAEVRIRHAGNSDYYQAMISELTPEQRDCITALTADTDGAIETDEMPDIDGDVAEETNEVLRRLAAEHILVDWRGLEVKDENLAEKLDAEPEEPIEYSPERAEILFEEIPQFYNEVKKIAQQEAAFTKETEEADKGN